VGVTVIDCNVAAVTNNVAEPKINPDVAVIVVVPAAKPMALPTLEIVAAAELDEDQLTEAVRSCVELSE
jgi:hypothetical protein